MKASARVAQLQVKLPRSTDFNSFFGNFLLVLYHDNTRLKFVWKHAHQRSVSSPGRNKSRQGFTRELPQLPEESFKEIKLVFPSQQCKMERVVPKPGKVLRESSSREQRLPKDLAVLYAQQAVLREKKAMKAAQEKARATSARADYVEESFVKQIGAVQWRQEERMRNAKEYKNNMALAKQLVRKSAEMEAAQRREEVRRRKELERLRLTSFPFRPAGRLLLSSGPTPFRRLAAARSKPVRKTVAFAYDKHGRRKEAVDGLIDPGSSITPLHEAFAVLRQLASTYEEFYLDFNKLLLSKSGSKRRSRISKRALFGRILKGVELNHRERRLLWRHFIQHALASDISVEDIKIGFYNQRTLLSKYKRHVEAEKLRETILKQSSSVTAAAELESLESAFQSDPEVTRIVVDVERVKGVQSSPDKIFCIGALAKQVGKHSIIVLNEVRCTLEDNYRLRFDVPSDSLDGDEKLLLEFRTKNKAAASDVNSSFIGEIFQELEQLQQKFAEWIPLVHGKTDAFAQITIKMCNFKRGSEEFVSSPQHEDQHIRLGDELNESSLEDSADEESYRCAQEKARQGINELLTEQGLGDFPEVRTNVSREIDSLLSQHYGF